MARTKKSTKRTPKKRSAKLFVSKLTQSRLKDKLENYAETEEEEDELPARFVFILDKLFETEERLTVSEAKVAKKMLKMVKKKNALKRQTGYHLFLKDQFENCINCIPRGMTVEKRRERFGELAKTFGQDWRNLSVVAKEKYNDDADKIRLANGGRKRSTKKRKSPKKKGKSTKKKAKSSNKKSKYTKKKGKSESPLRRSTRNKNARKPSLAYLLKYY